MSFVHYDNKLSCPLAIQALNNKQIGGLKLKVSLRINKNPKPLGFSACSQPAYKGVSDHPIASSAPEAGVARGSGFISNQPPYINK